MSYLKHTNTAITGADILATMESNKDVTRIDGATSDQAKANGIPVGSTYSKKLDTRHKIAGTICDSETSPDTP